MPSTMETTPLLRGPPKIGEYAPAPANASRSPCPVVNALANHGYIERSGRNIYKKDLNDSMGKVGMSRLLGSIFAYPTYFEFHDPARAALEKPVGFFTRIWRLITNPYSFFSYFGCWKSGQVNKDGEKYLNLEDLATHGAIEHDISLSRRDIGQKQGNNAMQPDLVDDLLACSSDGGKTLSTEDIGQFIKNRIEQQLQDNPQLVYGPPEHQVNCGQVALMMGCFGDGKRVKCEFVRAIFKDERLPTNEGWNTRPWWRSMGVIEFFSGVKEMTNKSGVQF